MATLAAQEAERLKDEGNCAMRAREFEKAVKLYTDALDKDFNMILLLNRSEAYLRLGRHGYAYVDANEALRINEKNFKGLVRRGKARIELGFEAGAVADLEKAIAIEPTNGDTKLLLEQFKVRAAAAEAERVKLADEEDSDIEEKEQNGGSK